MTTDTSFTYHRTLQRRLYLRNLMAASTKHPRLLRRPRHNPRPRRRSLLPSPPCLRIPYRQWRHPRPLHSLPLRRVVPQPRPQAADSIPRW